MRLGTRASPLALTQARLIARMLEKAHRGLSVDLVEITTTGDTVRDKPLHEFGGRGVFVKELENALLGQRIDLAVHSLKDLPTRQPRGLGLGALVGREDTRDVAVLQGGRKLADLLPGSVIGTGSPRRKAQLKAQYPRLEFAEIRGNVETRVRKVQAGQYAGTILARAGLKRLGLLSPGSLLAGLTAQVLPHSVMLPAPGQGALAIECRVGDTRVRRLLAAIHDREVCACVTAERVALQALGGGCHLPLGALCVLSARSPAKARGAAHPLPPPARGGGTQLRFRAVLGLPDGTLLVRAEGAMPVAKARELGRKVARQILEHGGRELLARLTEPHAGPQA